MFMHYILVATGYHSTQFDSLDGLGFFYGGVVNITGSGLSLMSRTETYVLLQFLLDISTISHLVFLV